MTDLQYASLSSNQQAAVSVTKFDDTFSSISDFTALGENAPGALTTYNADGSVSISVDNSDLSGSAAYSSTGTLESETLAYSNGNTVSLSNSGGYTEVDEVTSSGQQSSQINTASGVYATTAEVESDVQFTVRDPIYPGRGDLEFAEFFETGFNTANGAVTLSESLYNGQSVGLLSSFLEGDDVGSAPIGQAGSGPDPILLSNAPISVSVGWGDNPEPSLAPPLYQPYDPSACDGAAQGVSIGIGGLVGYAVGIWGYLAGFGLSATALSCDDPQAGSGPDGQSVDGFNVWDGQSFTFVPDGQMTVDLGNGQSETVIGTPSFNSAGSITAITETVIAN